VRLDNWLAQRSETCPERAAVIAAGETISYAELERRAGAVARRLAGQGVRRGSNVTLEIEPGITFAVALHALMKLGAVVCPLNARAPEAERERVCAALQPALRIKSEIDPGLTEADFPLLGEVDLDAIHCRIQTSGTSGRTRTVGLTYGNHLWSAVGSGFNLGVNPDDRWLCCLPTYHVSGLSILLRSAIYGTGAVVHPGFDPERIGRSLREDGVTLVSLVATQLNRLLDLEVDLSGPRAILVGGGPVPEESLQRAADSGAVVVQTYGMTEAASQVTTLAPADAERKRGSAGRPLLTTHLRIEDGEILVQGPTVSPECTDEGGWLHTGDLGWIDDEGFLYVTDRMGDVIVTGGENVMPAEIEEVLMRHPDVAEAAVVGRPDEQWQEAVHAVVVPVNGHRVDAEGLIEFCRGELADFKVPKAIEVADRLPRTASGKLVRRELRDPASAR
jgi:O-succinylbenzoic acid--CoA ligase